MGRKHIINVYKSTTYFIREFGTESVPSEGTDRRVLAVKTVVKTDEYSSAVLW